MKDPIRLFLAGLLGAAGIWLLNRQKAILAKVFA